MNILSNLEYYKLSQLMKNVTQKKFFFLTKLILGLLCTYEY